MISAEASTTSKPLSGCSRSARANSGSTLDCQRAMSSSRVRAATRLDYYDVLEPRPERAPRFGDEVTRRHSDRVAAGDETLGFVAAEHGEEIAPEQGFVRPEPVHVIDDREPNGARETRRVDAGDELKRELDAHELRHAREHDDAHAPAAPFAERRDDLGREHAVT